MSPNYHVHISNGYGPGHRLYISWDDFTAPRGPNGDTAIHIVTGLTTAVHEAGDDYNVTDGLRNADALIQAIIDAAWEKGFRPVGYTDVRRKMHELIEQTLR